VPLLKQNPDAAIQPRGQKSCPYRRERSHIKSPPVGRPACVVKPRQLLCGLIFPTSSSGSSKARLSLEAGFLPCFSGCPSLSSAGCLAGSASTEAADSSRAFRAAWWRSALRSPCIALDSSRSNIARCDQGTSANTGEGAQAPAARVPVCGRSGQSR